MLLCCKLVRTHIVSVKTIGTNRKYLMETHNFIFELWKVNKGVCVCVIERRRELVEVRTYRTILVGYTIFTRKENLM